MSLIASVVDDDCLLNHLLKAFRLLDSGDLILHLIFQSFIELGSEGSVSPVDVLSDSVESSSIGCCCLFLMKMEYLSLSSSFLIDLFKYKVDFFFELN